MNVGTELSYQSAALNEVEEDVGYYSEYLNSSEFEISMSNSKNETGEFRRRKK